MSYAYPLTPGDAGRQCMRGSCCLASDPWVPWPRLRPHGPSRSSDTLSAVGTEVGSLQSSDESAICRARRDRRSGAILVLFALLLILLVGMVGLVIDAGLLMAAHRHAQNAADAGALAAAQDILEGRDSAAATDTATRFVTEHNQDSEARIAMPAPTVNIPPTSGPYAGMTNYAEVIVQNPTPTYFIHVLPGVASENTVGAQAVARVENRAAGAGVIALDPKYKNKPGVGVTGGARLIVNGRVYDNSELGGVDENGKPIDNGNTGVAGSVANNSTLIATEVRVVGGVDNPENFESYDAYADPQSDTQSSEPRVLRTGELPVPDPLLTLPTPTVANGVDPTRRGSPTASDGGLYEGTVSPSANYIETDATTGKQTLVLHPGIYDSIKITGGKVRFEPGIYVLSPQVNTTTTLNITGGDVSAKGVMFYNTGSTYDPQTGLPDSLDGEHSPPAENAHFGGVTINAAMEFLPIDFDKYSYDPMYRPSDDFEGMLFYQRRRNTEDISLQGDAEEGNLAGTLYAKWAHFKIAGQGTYDAQFIAGSIAISGQGDVTINYVGDKIGKAPQVFLVE